MSLTAERPPTGDDQTTHPRGDRFVGAALLSMTAAMLLVQLLARHVIPPLAIFAGVTAVLGLATWRRAPRWLLGVDGVVAVLYLAGSVEFMVANLAHPESPAGFLAEVVVLLGFLTVLLGAVTGIARRGDGARRISVRVAGAILAVAVVGSAIAATGVDSTARQDGDVTITSERSVFTPQVETVAGTSVLWVDNRDPFHHTIVIDDTDIRADMVALTSVRVPVDLEPGSYRFWCDVPGHEAMEGVLHVR
jgi:plastocyanin